MNYAALAENIRQSFRKKFIKPDGLVKVRAGDLSKRK